MGLLNSLLGTLKTQHTLNSEHNINFDTNHNFDLRGRGCLAVNHEIGEKLMLLGITSILSIVIFITSFHNTILNILIMALGVFTSLHFYQLITYYTYLLSKQNIQYHVRYRSLSEPISLTSSKINSDCIIHRSLKSILNNNKIIALDILIIQHNKNNLNGKCNANFKINQEDANPKDIVTTQYYNSNNMMFNTTCYFHETIPWNGNSTNIEIKAFNVKVEGKHYFTPCNKNFSWPLIKRKNDNGLIYGGVASGWESCEWESNMRNRGNCNYFEVKLKGFTYELIQNILEP